MTLEQFQSKKREISLQMNILLNEAKQQKLLGGKTFRNCLMKQKTVTMEIRKDAKHVEKDIQKFMTYRRAFPNTLVEADHHILYYSDIYVGTYYHFQHLVLIDSITEVMVKMRMQKYVKSMIGMESSKSLDCQVMQFFKDGKIVWEDVVKAHKEGCSL